MASGKQIRSLRKEHPLSREDSSQNLNISGKPDSNWENNKNLSDNEVLVAIGKILHLPFDSLILGGNDMNDMTEKLIRDASEKRKAKINLISTGIGTVLLIIGIVCLVIRAASGDYVDADGLLHESFFLVPIAFIFFFGGFMTFLVTGIRNVVELFRKNSSTGKENTIAYLISSSLVVVICLILFLLLKAANS